VNIAVIAPNDLYLESLKTALSQISGFSVALECRNWCDTIVQIAGKQIDVILINSAICENDPGGFVKQIRFFSPGAKILMLLDRNEECWRDQAIECGADDVLPQYADKKTLEKHIWQLK